VFWRFATLAFRLLGGAPLVFQALSPHGEDLAFSLDEFWQVGQIAQGEIDGVLFVFDGFEDLADIGGELLFWIAAEFSEGHFDGADPWAFFENVLEEACTVELGQVCWKATDEDSDLLRELFSDDGLYGAAQEGGRLISPRQQLLAAFDDAFDFSDDLLVGQD
jgi:hypothetical protein